MPASKFDRSEEMAAQNEGGDRLMSPNCAVHHDCDSLKEYTAYCVFMSS
jgi:hypothetical protein